ncbi:amidohydrolase [Amycolatopsis sp. NPDC051061]|uniref:amidohydrolase n=1 Tax=Amycolatopsis sp. NPDC051061 TaxID=3155042 RepID=UPI0034177E03
MRTDETAGSRDVALVGGHVVPVAGDPVSGGTVLVEDGRITAVGADVRVPAHVPVVDVRGRWVLPGLVDAHSHLGLIEDGEGWAGADGNEVTDPNGARLRALDGINPADPAFADALAGGVTCCLVKPGSSNPIGGQAVAIKTWGRTVDELTVRAPAGVKSALGENPKRAYGDRQALPSTRMGTVAVLRDAFVAARDHVASAADGSAPKTHHGHEALAGVLAREYPLFQHAHRADDIATAIRLADEFGYRLVLVHATEARFVAGLLAERDVPCVIGPLIHSRSKVELRQRDPVTAAVLVRAGVPVALTTDHPFVPIDLLALQAILAVRAGLAPDDALRAITVVPAAIMGLADRVGALRPGLDGDVVVWSGNPLDIYQRVLRVFVSGREVFTATDTSVDAE